MQPLADRRLVGCARRRNTQVSNREVSGLLPQPGAFEGVALVVELAKAHDHAFPDRDQFVADPSVTV